MHPNTARRFWKALMDNASGLIVDAHALLERGSFGRARSLTVLAQKELGKGLWIYEVFSESWSSGAQDALAVPRLRTDNRRHPVKYMEAFVFSQELAAFWVTTGHTTFRSTARRSTGTRTSPRRPAMRGWHRRESGYQEDD